MAQVHNTYVDPSGWSYDIVCEESGIRSVLGRVYTISCTNNSTYTIHLWVDYKGQRLMGTVDPGTSFTHDLTSFNVLQGEVTAFGAY